MSMRERQTGLSMVEVMIAMLVMAVVTSQALGMLSSQLHTFHSQKRVLETQEDARLVADMILVDLRMAGFMVPNTSGVSSVDGGAGGADSLCVSEWTTFDEAQLQNASAVFDRASLTADVAAGNTTVAVTVAEMDVDGDGDDDFVIGEGIIIADSDDSHCARITAIAGGTITFTPGSVSAIDSTDSARAVPAIVYEVAATGLTRNNLLLSSQVEDMQIEYAIDLNDDGLIGVGEFPIHTLATNATEAIRGVRLSVLTRTVSPDTQLTGAGLQIVANRTNASPADNFRRRLVTVNAAPRNLL